jgi:hypothetical protein
MGTKGRILLHLAAALTGWGIARPILSPVPEAAEVTAPGKASAREARDREAGEKLLRRLVPDLAPASPAEVVRHEGTLEERVKKAIEDDPFSSFKEERFEKHALRYLREEIHDLIQGVDGPDLSHAFRNGRLEAREILDALGQVFPDLATEAMFPKAVFLELFSIDPTRASLIHDGLDSDERAGWMLDAYSSSSVVDDPFEFDREVPTDWRNPPTLLAWIDLAVSHQLDNHTMFSSDQIARLTTGYRDDYGDDYSKWLFDQPPTKGRERMLKSLAGKLEKDDPAAAAALKKRLSTR